MPKLIAALSLAAMMRTDIGQQAPNCAPPDRRATAIAFARQINTAEAAAHNQTGRYAALVDLQVASPSPGFQVQLSSDGTSYTFSVKDTLDACHGAAFSDQAGLIYTGTPIR